MVAEKENYSFSVLALIHGEGLKSVLCIVIAIHAKNREGQLYVAP
jgi:hypothetical protein